MKKTKQHRKGEKKDLTTEQQERLRQAEREFRRLLQEIEPFLRVREQREYSTMGEWTVATYDE